MVEGNAVGLELVVEGDTVRLKLGSKRSAIEAAPDLDLMRTGVLMLVLSIAKNRCARARARATISLSDVLVCQEPMLLMIVMICGF
jgi:hypothetical protein